MALLCSPCCSMRCNMRRLALCYLVLLVIATVPISVYRGTYLYFSQLALVVFVFPVVCCITCNRSHVETLVQHCNSRRLALFYLVLLGIAALITPFLGTWYLAVFIPIILSVFPIVCCIAWNRSCVETQLDQHSDQPVLVSDETRLNIVNDHPPKLELNHPPTLHVITRQDDSCIDLRPWRSYTHAELTTATNNFDQSNLLGGGGQANVFSGVESQLVDEAEGSLGPGRNIAVKRFYFVSNNADELQHANLQFKREVQALSRASHRNVVEFYGYCIHGRERLLVYELVPNGSLHDWLLAPVRDHRRGTLDNWGQRLTIAKDAARGLDYLHNHCNINLVHLDIKPQNILLDEMLHAKIADFGLSKLIGRDQTRLTGGTLVGGTPGYRPPELNPLVEGWENNITKKADVYSFGIVLLQLASGRMVSSPPTVDSTAPPTFVMPGQTFRDAAFHLVKTQQTHLLLDASLIDKEACNNKVGLRMSEIATMCVEMNPMNRPNMGEVSELLDAISSC